MAETVIGTDAVVVYGLSTDTKTVRPAGSLFIETDTGLEFSSDGAAWFQRNQIQLDSRNLAATKVVAEIYNETVNEVEAFADLLSGTQQSKEDVDSATTVTIKFSELAAATATVAYVAFNQGTGSAGAVAAGVVLADSSLRYEIPKGDSITVHFSADTPLTEIHAISDAGAEAGSTSLSMMFSRGA